MTGFPFWPDDISATEAVLLCTGFVAFLAFLVIGSK